ncbi:MAG: RimK/LysX family protein [bacterium]|nr:RimK/LysX family protein [bacterium]MDN5835282.1 RimK/LysX family protein [bacterium]
MTEHDNSQVIVGSFELVDIPALGIKQSIAKVDTGAYSGALHCSQIKETISTSGQKALYIVPSDNYAHSLETTDYIVTYVRSSTGHRVKRYLIDVDIVVQNQTYEIRIGLSDRSSMKHEILIGRRFLRQNEMLVDVNVNEKYDTDGGRSLL